VLLAVIYVLAAIGFVYFVLPRLAGLGPTLRRLRQGDLWWLALGAFFECVSFFGEIALLRGVFARGTHPIGWRTSTEVSLAGAAATKLFATAGAGGLAVMAWGVHGMGVPSAEVGNGLVCYEVVTYAVYLLAVAICGFGLWTGVFSGHAPLGLTVVPAVFAAAAMLIVVLTMTHADAATAFAARKAQTAHGRLARMWRWFAAGSGTARAGVGEAVAMVRRRDPSVLGAVVYWGFDIATLWASFRAFGHSPPGAVLTLGYFIGQLGNTLPLPGGVGGVEGGMIGAFLGFGVSGHLAVLAVLAYRTISYWLPTIPGAIAYFGLRRRISAARSEAPA
jgi:uncharacterized membrane protein YbhN (UPF0104 family)